MPSVKQFANCVDLQVRSCRRREVSGIGSGEFVVVLFTERRSIQTINMGKPVGSFVLSGKLIVVALVGLVALFWTRRKSIT
jgi:hypothetical protein